MNERMRFDPAGAARDGFIDADDLLVDLQNLCGDNPATTLSRALDGIIGLAIENRIEECEARKAAFCEVIGSELLRVRRTYLEIIGIQSDELARLATLGVISPGLDQMLLEDGRGAA